MAGGELLELGVEDAEEILAVEKGDEEDEGEQGEEVGGDAGSFPENENRRGREILLHNI